MENKFTKREILLITLAFMIILPMFIYAITITIKVRTCDTLEFNSQIITTDDIVYKYLNENVSYNFDETNRTKIRTKIENLLDLKFYAYKEYNKICNGRAYGQTVLGFRKIKIANYLDTNTYIETFCHEAVHLKYYNCNERWTTFKTFTILFESEDKDFKQCAINWAFRYIKCYTKDETSNCISNNMPEEKYDATYYMINYLRSYLAKNL